MTSLKEKVAGAAYAFNADSLKKVTEEAKAKNLEDQQKTSEMEDLKQRLLHEKELDKAEDYVEQILQKAHEEAKKGGSSILAYEIQSNDWKRDDAWHNNNDLSIRPYSVAWFLKEELENLGFKTQQVDQRYDLNINGGQATYHSEKYFLKMYWES